MGAILALAFSARLRDNSVLQYLAAGRSLSMPAFVATLVSTWYGGILGIGEAVTFFGLGTWVLLGVPYYVFAVIYALAFARKVRGAEQISIPERLTARWGKSAGIISAVLLFLLAVPAAHVLMLGVLGQVMVGWDRQVAIVVAATVCGLLLYRGGLLADVRVAMLAFVGMYVGFGAILAWSVAHHQPAQVWNNLSPAMRSWDGGSGLVSVVSFFILGAWTIVDPGFHQRVASSATPEIGRKGVLASVGFWLIFDILSISTGLYALGVMNPVPSGLEVFPRYGDAVLPPGLKALFFCGMLGTIVSACVGYTLISGASFGREIVARIKPGLADSAVKSWMRIGMGLATVIAIVLAIRLDSVVTLWYAWGGCVVGALLLPVTSAYLFGHRRVPATWVSLSMAISFMAAVGWMFFGLTHDNPLLEAAWVPSVGGWMLPPIAEGTDSIRFGVGTLAPALVISASILGIGAMVGRRQDGDRRSD